MEPTQVESLLPPELRGSETQVTRIDAGLSGATNYRVEAGDQVLVLKVAGAREGAADWQRALQLQRLAAEAGLAPRIVHTHEAARAVLSVFVADRSFIALVMAPATRTRALTLLGQTVRRVHALPLPDGVIRPDPRELLVQLWDELQSAFPLPGFVGQAVDRALSDALPPPDALVLGHNDLNPSNLVYDGQQLVLLDWATAGASDPFHDLATPAAFLRLTTSDCLTLLSAYEGAPAAELPHRFIYRRRLVAAVAGAMQLHIAREFPSPEAAVLTPDSALDLGEFYQRMRSGALRLGTFEGQRAFGLALLKESLST